MRYEQLDLDKGSVPVKVLVTALIMLFSGCGGTTDSTGDAGAVADGQAETIADAAAEVVVFNGCTAADYADGTTDPSARRVAVGAVYSPRCLVVRAGQNVVFKGDISAHPMLADPLSGPFAAYAVTGDEATVTFPEVGYFPYFDQNNKSSTGVVRVLP